VTHRGPCQPRTFCDSVSPPRARRASPGMLMPAPNTSVALPGPSPASKHPELVPALPGQPTQQRSKGTVAPLPQPARARGVPPAGALRQWQLSHRDVTPSANSGCGWQRRTVSGCCVGSPLPGTSPKKPAISAEKAKQKSPNQGER